jgi:preprotein translocase subunit SecD
MLRFSKIKIFVILMVCFLSIYFSIPSLFPAIRNTVLNTIMPESQINLGLDLRGGAYILLEVDLKTFQREQMQRLTDQLRMRLNSSGISYESLTISPEGLSFKVFGEDKKAARKAIAEVFGADATTAEEEGLIKIIFSETTLRSQKNALISQMIEIIRRRIDESGTKEIDLQRQGEAHILLQVPGLDDPEQIKRLLGKTAKLSFHLVDTETSVQEALEGKAPMGSKVLPLEGSEGRNQYIVIKSRSLISGDMLVDAQAGIYMNNPVVHFKFNNIGARIFGEVSSKNVGKPFAIVLDDKVISAPSIREPILGGQGQIFGNFSVESANELALLLRAGALPAPLLVAEERTIGPSLGTDSIEAGKIATIIGTGLVVLLMGLLYGFFGMIANLALVINLFMTIAIMAIFGFTLTMPGIAAMVLSLGMAVDANVLVFERIKEEVRNKRTILSSIETGYKMAFTTIIDSNVTTILAALILYIFGTGPIKSFAITLSVGIICSMFSAVLLTRLIIAEWYKRYKPTTLPM